MMQRRTFVTGIAAVIAAPSTALAQPGRQKKIGYLWPWSPPPEHDRDPARPRHTAHGDAMRDELAKHGWIEGGNLRIERRWARGRLELLPQLAAELVAANVDVLLAPTGTAGLAAKNATGTIPIVVVAGDIVDQGLVSNLARPDGNVTGVTLLSIELIGKRLHLLRELLPGARQVAVLGCGHPAGLGLAGSQWRSAHATATTLNLELIRYSPETLDDVRAALDDASRRQTHALFLLDCPLFNAIIDKRIFVNHRLPGMYYLEIFAHAGGLVSYGIDEVILWRRAAWYVGRILNGAKPGDLPVEQAHLRLVVNGKTARALKLTIPPSLLLRADQVIE